MGIIKTKGWYSQDDMRQVYVSIVGMGSHVEPTDVHVFVEIYYSPNAFIHLVFLWMFEKCIFFIIIHCELYKASID